MNRREHGESARGASPLSGSGTGPRLGVIVPCYNYGRFLSDCVRSLLDQTFRDWEAVIVDDGSNDGATTAAIAALARGKVRTLRFGRHRGLSVVRNEALRQFPASPFVTFVDADDRIEAGYFEKLVGAIAADESAGGVFGTQIFTAADGATPTGRTWPDETFGDAGTLREPGAPGSGTVYRMAALRATTGWRPEFASCFEDWELGLQILDAGWTLRWIPSASYFYRRHGDAILENWDDARASRFRARLLRFHRGRIAREVGVRSYLRRYVVPVLAGNLRYGHLRGAARLAVEAGRAAPVALAAELLAYYRERIDERTAR